MVVFVFNVDGRLHFLHCAFRNNMSLVFRCAVCISISWKSVNKCHILPLRDNSRSYLSTFSNEPDVSEAEVKAVSYVIIERWMKQIKCFHEQRLKTPFDYKYGAKRVCLGRLLPSVSISWLPTLEQMFSGL